jgi:hypothetical protein
MTAAAAPFLKTHIGDLYGRRSPGHSTSGRRHCQALKGGTIPAFQHPFRGSIPARELAMPLWCQTLQKRSSKARIILLPSYPHARDRVASEATGVL